MPQMINRSIIRWIIDGRAYERHARMRPVPSGLFMVALMSAMRECDPLVKPNLLIAKAISQSFTDCPTFRIASEAKRPDYEFKEN